MPNKKYKIDRESSVLQIGEHTLYRVECIEDFSNVKKGDLGGWIESENNLSQCGNCWVGDDAKVFGLSVVWDDAIVDGTATVMGKSNINGTAHVSGHAMVNNSQVYDNALVTDYAKIFDAFVYGNAIVKDKVFVDHNSDINGDAVVSDEVYVSDRSTVTDNAKVSGKTLIRNGATIQADAVVKNLKDYITYTQWWDNGNVVTWTRTNNKWHMKGFFGSTEELLAFADDTDKVYGLRIAELVRYHNTMQCIENTYQTDINELVDRLKEEIKNDNK